MEYFFFGIVTLLNEKGIFSVAVPKNCHENIFLSFHFEHETASSFNKNELHLYTF